MPSSPDGLIFSSAATPEVYDPARGLEINLLGAMLIHLIAVEKSKLLTIDCILLPLYGMKLSVGGYESSSYETSR